MSLWQLSIEWEYNGRDDSDFYVVCYDDEKDELKRLQTYSTRYYCTDVGAGIVNYTFMRLSLERNTRLDQLSGCPLTNRKQFHLFAAIDN